MSSPIPDKGIKCHMTGFTKSCHDMVTKHRCRKWIQVQGLHPQTGEQINQWDCADAWMPLLLISNSQQQAQTGAAVESLRNELVDGITEAVGLAAQEAGRLIDRKH